MELLHGKINIFKSMSSAYKKDSSKSNAWEFVTFSVKCWPTLQTPSKFSEWLGSQKGGGSYEANIGKKFFVGKGTT